MNTLYLIGKSNALYESINYTINTFPEQKIKVVPAKSDADEDNWQFSIKKLCKEKKLSIATLEDIYDDENAVVVSIQFDLILKPELFKTNQIFNIHFSLLPKYKGVYPAIWPILNGEQESGVTLHYIDEGIDTGDILDQFMVTIRPTDTARDLYYNCINAAIEIYKKNIAQIISGNLIAKKQPKLGSIYYSKKSIDFSNIKYNLNRTAWQIHNQLRGMNFREFQLPLLFDKKVYKSEILDTKSTGKPGSIASEEDNVYVIINTIDYQLKIYFDWYERLFELCKSGNVEDVKKCLIHIDDLEVCNKNGWNALIIAAYFEHLDIVKLLVEKGANVNAKNYKGTTVLMYAKSSAAKSDKTDVLAYLISKGADIHAKDNKGISLLDYCKKEGNDKILKFLNSVENN